MRSVYLVAFGILVAHDCGYPLSRYTCRATRVAADFLDFIAFCRCSTSVALHPLKILVSHLPPPPVPRGVAPKFGSEKVSRYTGVSQLQLRVSRYTVQLSLAWHWLGLNASPTPAQFTWGCLAEQAYVKSLCASCNPMCQIPIEVNPQAFGLGSERGGGLAWLSWPARHNTLDRRSFLRARAHTHTNAEIRTPLTSSVSSNRQKPTQIQGVRGLSTP